MLGAPWPVIALDPIMLATLCVTVRWKVSMHAAVCSGAAVVGGGLFALLV